MTYEFTAKTYLTLLVSEIKTLNLTVIVELKG